MIYERDIELLQRLLDATTRGKISWSEDEDDWFSTEVAGRDISFRFLYYEATNQVGADPHTIEFHMPGCNAKFACGTLGFDLLLEVLSQAFDHWKERDPNYALEFLDNAFREDDLGAK